MQYNPQKHHRKSIRLQSYDYAQAGLYFVTINCQNKTSYFGHIHKKKMIFNDAGKMVQSELKQIANRFPNTRLDEFIIMPNHIHFILEIQQNKEPNKTNTQTLGEIIGAFKSITTVKYIQGVKSKNWTPFNKKLWQRDYYEHIIQSEIALINIRKYIQKNPSP